MSLGAIILDAASWGLLVTGAVLCVVGAIGLMRFPDVYSRCHAAGVVDNAGAALILIGLMLQAGLTLVTVKLILVLFFLLFTSPTATHALVRAARSGRVEPWTRERVAAERAARERARSAGDTPEGGAA